jgi:4-amino-4-deoxy-L-arabinose transferase-like glycosyltransferase
MMKRLYLPLAVFAVTWTILVVTAPGIPIVWDEQEYLGRARFILDWLREPFPFSQAAIRPHWLFINQVEGHPAGFAILIAIGERLAGPLTDPLTAGRLGPITLFSVACAAVAMRLKKDYGTAAAIAAPVMLVTFPRMFSEAHFATQDGQLTAWWLLLWTVQSSFSSTTRGAIGLGVVLGLTTATKFSGWLAWGPVIASQLIQRNTAALRRLVVVLPVALVVFYVLNAPLWHDPVGGLREHFDRNFSRATVPRIPILFLGGIYDLDHSLPWYNTLVWLLLVTPMPTLLLGIVGLWRSLTKPTVWSATLVLHWATLMIVRALPGAPPHDGVRLFLPALGFWCVFAGIGAQSVVAAIAAVPSAPARWALRSALVAALLSGAVTVGRYYPQTLSHYNLMAGGVRGAAERGMEPAYWWDGLDNDVLLWLNNSTSSGEAVAFSPIFDVLLLKAWGRLRPPAVNPEQATFKWYVLQNRPGMFTDLDRALMGHEKPAYVKYAGRRRAGQKVPDDLNVALISIFSFEQYQRARKMLPDR